MSVIDNFLSFIFTEVWLFVYKQECRDRPSSKKLDGPQRLCLDLGLTGSPLSASPCVHGLRSSTCHSQRVFPHLDGHILQQLPKRWSRKNGGIWHASTYSCTLPSYLAEQMVLGLEVLFPQNSKGTVQLSSQLWCCRWEVSATSNSPWASDSLRSGEALPHHATDNFHCKVSSRETELLR